MNHPRHCGGGASSATLLHFHSGQASWQKRLHIFHTEVDSFVLLHSNTCYEKNRTMHRAGGCVQAQHSQNRRQKAVQERCWSTRGWLLAVG
jgi:hypothetical protein